MWWAVWIGCFCQNWGILQTRMDQRGLTSKWILTIFKYKNECYKQSAKSEWRKWGHLSSFQASFLSYGICPKKNIFYNCVLTSARNVSLLKQFTYMHLNVLITLFQKMIWFIGVRATVNEILTIEMSKKMLTQQKVNTSNTNTPEIASHSKINNTIFWKCITRPFKC